MSLAAIRAAFEVTGVGPTAKFVLIAIANRANSEGRTWPSQAVLAVDTELSRRTVQNAIETLVKAGFVEVIHRNGRPNVYNVLPAHLLRIPAHLTTKTGASPAHEPIRNQSRTARAASAPVENPGSRGRYFMPGTGWIEDFTTYGGNGVHP